MNDDIEKAEKVERVERVERVEELSHIDDNHKDNFDDYIHQSVRATHENNKNHDKQVNAEFQSKKDKISLEKECTLEDIYCKQSYGHIFDIPELCDVEIERVFGF